MIVDFIKVKHALDKAANMFIRAQIKKRTPFVSQIGVIPQHEGSDASYETVDRQVQEIDYQLTLSKPIELTKEQMGRLSLDEIQGLLTEVAEDMAHKIESTALGKLGQILEDTGNTVVESGPLGPESFLRSLEVMQVDFDDVRERPHIPQIVLHPNTFAKLKEQTDKMSADELNAIERRREQILDKKYEEYVSRENNRNWIGIHATPRASMLIERLIEEGENQAERQSWRAYSLTTRCL